MKEAFLAALLSVGPNVDGEIRIMQISNVLGNSVTPVVSTYRYTPAISASDTRTDHAPGIVRHVMADL